MIVLPANLRQTGGERDVQLILGSVTPSAWREVGNKQHFVVKGTEVARACAETLQSLAAVG